MNRGLAVSDVAAIAARDGLDVALALGEIPAILAVDWAALRASAIVGIGEMVRVGEISPGVAVSLLERVDSFGASIASLRGGM